MVNLIRNENMKIYRRPRTWVMIGFLVIVTGLMSFILWYDSGRHLLGEDWRDSARQQIAVNKQVLSDENLPDSIKREIQRAVNEQQYRLDHDIKPLAATMWGNVVETSNLVVLITLFVVIIAGDTIASEFSAGTIKLLLIRPASRTKIMLSKYAAALLYGVLLLIVLLVSSMLINGVLYGMSGWNQPFLTTDDAGTIRETSMLLHIAGTYLLNTISTIMYVTMAFMISAVFRSSAMAIGLSIFTIFTGFPITMLLSRFEWSKYILFANIDLITYLRGTPFKPDMTLGFSVTVLLAYFALFHLLAWLAFTRRDVAA